VTTTVDEATYVGGPADGHPVAFVHGAGLSWRMWLPRLRALEDEYRVVTPDLPGHGRRADEPFTFDAAVRVLDDLHRDEVDEPALVVGQSLCGYVAVEYAARRPARVAGLVLSGASADYRGVLGVTTWVAGLLDRVRAAIGPLDGRFREGVEADLEDGPPAPTHPAVESDEIPDAGHTCSTECPDEYTAIVREFATDRGWAGAGEAIVGAGSEA
jgi:pimeloyl-ACP methyl ester carboxylesterase